MFCSNCGAQTGNEVKFCGGCGTPRKVKAVAKAKFPVKRVVPIVVVLLVVVAAAVVIAVNVTGSPSGLVGTWEQGTFTLELSRDGTGRLYDSRGNWGLREAGRITWEASDTTLVIRPRQPFHPITGNFEVVGNSLIITGVGGGLSGTWARN